MRVFDFDNTIYNGESVFEFYLFSIKYNPKVAKYVPLAVFNLLKYKLGKTTMQDLEDAVKNYSSFYMNSFDNKEKLVQDFWNSHMKKIKPWYKPQADDVIITANFNMLIDEACNRLGVKNCICSIINRKTLKVEYLNFKENKRKTFLEKYKNCKIDEFYTDTMLDKPMIDVAERAYLVKGNKITRIK